ncbi:MAG TPA: fimbrial assembly protein [Acidobacteriaceae bacterium]|jgi:type IV pilus assembly protein PilN|nr:fimbrial assembly protein [Acidobacteriaceae bacterium]
MKITLNLASQPYVDLRMVLRRLRMVMLVLILIAIPLLFLLKAEHKKAEAATVRVEQMQSNVRNLERQQQSYEALMKEPQNAAVLTQAGYLNGLFRRKAFSWTATMTDLETVLPSGVQVLSLDPAITKSGAVQIHLRVSGARDRAIQLVQNLEKSKHFASPRLAGEMLAQTQGQGQNNSFQPVTNTTAVNFDILADYRPVTPEEKAAEDKQAEENKTAAKDKESGSAKPTERAALAGKRGAR